MLNFYTDSALTRPVTLATPKLFCVPLEGGSCTTQLYLGDGYTATLAQVAIASDTTIYLDQAAEFRVGGGTASLAGVSFSYTGKTANTLTGVSGLHGTFVAGLTLKPHIKYLFSGNVLVAVTGADALDSLSQIALSLKRSDQAQFGFRGTPAIYTTQEIDSGNVIEVDVTLTVLAGDDTRFANLGLLVAGYVVRAQEDLTAVLDSDQRLSSTCLMVVARHNQGLHLFQRLLRQDRKVQDNLPGFVVGDYRWRDKASVNAQTLIPTNWNVDTSKIPVTAFLSGIADADDLKPLHVEESKNSLYLRIQDGFYFNRNIRSYLPAAALLEILPTNNPFQIYTLTQSVANQTPIFVGCWTATQSAGFVKSSEYRYVGHKFDTTSGDHQFTINRKSGTLTLKGLSPVQSILLGSVSGDPTEYFDIPLYPVDGVSQVYVDRGPGLPRLIAPSFLFNKETGALQLAAIPKALVGQPIFAVCNPGAAVLYAQNGTWVPGTVYVAGTCITFNNTIFRIALNGQSGAASPQFDLAVDSVTFDGSTSWVCEGPVNTLRAETDLNPAFAGISQGFLYLTHNYQGAYTIKLACDKPRISIPPSVVNEPGLVAFGPVYYDGDYALLIATVLDSNSNPIPNVELKVVPALDFDGTINYQIPTNANPIIVRTGGDGVANLVYTPRAGFGFYLPLSSTSQTHLAGDTVTLQTPVPLNQLWNALEGWLTTFYQVKADNPYFGVVGANAAAGQIEFSTTAPGVVPFRTNGRRVPLVDSSSHAILPIEARDTAGRMYTDPLFNTLVSSLTFPMSVLGDAVTAAYFITYMERVTLSLQAVDSNVKSNRILLQMAPPPLLADTTPFLILDNLQSGILDKQRLAYFGASIYFPGSALA